MSCVIICVIFMDAESTSAIKFLQAITEVHEVLGEFAGRLRDRPETKTATVYRFSPKEKYFGEHNSDGTIVWYSGDDFGVSIELNSGSVVDWWLELGWNQSNWRLEYNVHRRDSNEDGSHIAVPFSESKSTSLDLLIQQLNDALSELTATEKTIFG